MSQPYVPAQTPPTGQPSGVKDLFNGVGYLLRGIAWMARHPAQWLFGLIPALIVLTVYVTALVFLAFQIDDLAGWVTGFADDWSDTPRTWARIVAGTAIYGAALFLAVLTFTAVTLLVGDPFYEAIAVRVEESQGGAPPEPDVPLIVQIGRAIKDAVLLGAVALTFAVVFFVCGFLPVVGQTVVPLVAALVSGYFLAGELTSVALERRGIRRTERFARLKANRPLAIGFGVATLLVFLVPLGAVLAMPGAVAGGTLLARERLADPPQAKEALVTPGEGGPAWSG
ncbi:EI24 domain-containing protein [Actinomadura sp. KC216]|uniref:EI24 domain-containing protein n=1 Tax=Actinomadura sp. KC216 TaxID=2530370 RepID=UPI001FB79267|nr:EI24 domain-containing protein [Actinomadura sp. KC216]